MEAQRVPCPASSSVIASRTCLFGISGAISSKGTLPSQANRVTKAFISVERGIPIPAATSDAAAFISGSTRTCIIGLTDGILYAPFYVWSIQCIVIFKLSQVKFRGARRPLKYCCYFLKNIKLRCLRSPYCVDFMDIPTAALFAWGIAMVPVPDFFAAARL